MSRAPAANVTTASVSKVMLFVNRCTRSIVKVSYYYILMKFSVQKLKNQIAGVFGKVQSLIKTVVGKFQKKAAGICA